MRLGSLLGYIWIAITDSLQAAVRAYAGENDNLNEITWGDVGMAASDEERPPLFVLSADTMQAAAVRGFHTSAIVITEDLLDSFPDDEIEAILQHELAHTEQATRTDVLLNVVVSTVLPLLLSRLARRRSGRAAGVLVFAAGYLGGVAVTRWSARQRELQADGVAAERMGTSEPLARALYRLDSSREEENPAPRLFASHPPVEERIAALTDKSRDELFEE